MRFFASIFFVLFLFPSFSIWAKNEYPCTITLFQGSDIAKAMNKSKRRIVISSEIDLNGGTMIVSKGKILEFKQNGSLKNGVIDARQAAIKTNKTGIFDNCILKAKNIKASWFKNIDYSLLLSSQSSFFQFEVDKDIEIKKECELTAPFKIICRNGSIIKDSSPIYIKKTAKGSTIRGVTFDGQWKNGICLWITASDIDLSSCTFLNHKGDNVYVIYLGRMQHGYNENIKIHGCTFDGMESITDGVGKGKGFNAAISSASSYRNIQIYDCLFKNQVGEDDGEGISIAGEILDNTKSWPNKDDENTLRYGQLCAKIYRNRFYDMTVSAIKVFGKDIDIYDNYIFNSTWNSERGGKSLVRVLEAEKVRIENNTFVSTIDVGCLSVMNSSDVLFRRNTFTCNTDGTRGLPTGSAYFKFQNVKDVMVENIKSDIRQGYVTQNTSVFNIMGGDNVVVKKCNVKIDNTDCLYQALIGNTYGNMYLEKCTFNVISSCAKWIYVNTRQFNDAKIHISDVVVNFPNIVPTGLSNQTLSTLPYVIRNLRVNGCGVKKM